MGTNIINDSFILFGVVCTLGGAMLSHGWPSPTSSGDGIGTEEIKCVTEEKDGRRLGTHQEYVISVTCKSFGISSFRVRMLKPD